MSYMKSFTSFLCVAGLAFVATLSFAQSKQSTPTEPIDASVSQITAKSESFNGKRVRFRARFESDGMERSVLLEPRCVPSETSPVDPKCKLGIVPYDAKGAENHADIKAFDRALEKGRPGTLDKRIVATFTGQFVCKPTCSAIGGRTLEVEAISDLDVTMIEPKASSKPK